MNEHGHPSPDEIGVTQETNAEQLLTEAEVANLRSEIAYFYEVFRRSYDPTKPELEQLKTDPVKKQELENYFTQALSKLTAIKWRVGNLAEYQEWDINNPEPMFQESDPPLTKEEAAKFLGELHKFVREKEMLFRVSSKYNSSEE